MVRAFVSICLGGVIATALGACAPAPDQPSQYLSQPLPGNDPLVFAPDFISKPDRWEGNAVFSPDGRAFYFNVFEGPKKSIYHSHWTNGEWSTPMPLAAIGDANNWEPFLTPDGQVLYFVSSRPPGSEEWNGRIWRSEWIGENWSAPELVDLAHETDGGYWFPNRSEAGNLYFGGNFPDVGNAGKGDGYVHLAGTNETVNIAAINTPYEEWDPYTDPNETFILWASDRPGGYGGTDLYISFKAEDRSWGPAVNLGPKINTEHYEVAARLSPDGEILFFDRPIDGTQDIYWVSMDEVLALNPNEIE